MHRIINLTFYVCAKCVLKLKNAANYFNFLEENLNFPHGNVLQRAETITAIKFKDGEAKSRKKRNNIGKARVKGYRRMLA